MLRRLRRRIKGPSLSRMVMGPMITVGVICCYDENVRLRPGEVHTCGHCGRSFELGQYWHKEWEYEAAAKAEATAEGGVDEEE